ncbi:MAG: TadE family protein [Phycisphaeraceae bacterium]|nr:TadE family protein [Phycisphaeraceae bacterium]
MMSTAAIPAGDRSWLYTALTSGPMLNCLALATLLTVLIAVLLRLTWRLRQFRSPGAALADTRATATVEFALVVPILLFLIMMLAQTTLLAGGHLFVHYSAFAATRTAIVQVPVDYSWRRGGGPNVYVAQSGQTKHEAIRRAAVLAVMPVSGRLESGSIDAEAFVDGLRDHYAPYSASPPRWIETLIAGRLRYADRHTSVELYATRTPNNVEVNFTPIDTSYTFEPVEPITVRVTHRFNLTVPYVGWVFADGRHSSDDGRGPYVDLDAHYTMINEGIIDRLPDPPSLPRIPD